MKQLLRILFAILITLCLFELAPAQIGRDSILKKNSRIFSTAG